MKGAALRKFLEEVSKWPNLKHSQDLKHFLTTDRQGFVCVRPRLDIVLSHGELVQSGVVEREYG